MTQFRQGDVFFELVEEAPNVEKLKKTEDATLAYGEVTGHSHRIETMEGVSRFLDELGDSYLFSEQDIAVRHEEHAGIDLPGKQWWKVRRQREYTPQGERRVLD